MTSVCTKLDVETALRAVYLCRQLTPTSPFAEILCGNIDTKEAEYLSICWNAAHPVEEKEIDALEVLDAIVSLADCGLFDHIYSLPPVVASTTALFDNPNAAAQLLRKALFTNDEHIVNIVLGEFIEACARAREHSKGKAISKSSRVIRDSIDDLIKEKKHASLQHLIRTLNFSPERKKTNAVMAYVFFNRANELFLLWSLVHKDKRMREFMEAEIGFNVDRIVSDMSYATDLADMMAAYPHIIRELNDKLWKPGEYWRASGQLLGYIGGSHPNLIYAALIRARSSAQVWNIMRMYKLEVRKELGCILVKNITLSSAEAHMSEMARAFPIIFDHREKDDPLYLIPAVKYERILRHCPVKLDFTIINMWRIRFFTEAFGHGWSCVNIIRFGSKNKGCGGKVCDELILLYNTTRAERKHEVLKATLSCFEWTAGDLCRFLVNVANKCKPLRLRLIFGEINKCSRKSVLEQAATLRQLLQIEDKRKKEVIKQSLEELNI